MKKNKLFFVFYILIFFCQGSVRGQETVGHIIDYKFVNGCSERQYRREFLSDSVFVEQYRYRKDKAPLDSQFATLDTFKVIGTDWWYCLNGEFYPFFSIEMFEDRVITKRHYNPIPDGSGYYSCMGYQPYKTETDKGRKLYVFKVNYDGCKEGNFNKIDITYMYFDPQIGFVKQKFWTCNMSELVVLREVPGN